MLHPNSANILSFQDPEVLIKTVLDEIGEPIAKKNVKVVVLRPEIPGGSVGITLAGGTDYEIKEISVSGKMYTLVPSLMFCVVTGA